MKTRDLITYITATSLCTWDLFLLMFTILRENNSRKWEKQKKRQGVYLQAEAPRVFSQQTTLVVGGCKYIQQGGINILFWNSDFCYLTDQQRSKWIWEKKKKEKKVD